MVSDFRFLVGGRWDPFGVVSGTTFLQRAFDRIKYHSLHSIVIDGDHWARTPLDVIGMLVLIVQGESASCAALGLAKLCSHSKRAFAASWGI
jgi:hypothetical protein